MKFIRKSTDKKTDKTFISENSPVTVTYTIGYTNGEKTASILTETKSFNISHPRGIGSEYDNIFMINNSNTIGQLIGKAYYQQNPKMKMLIRIFKNK